MCQLMVVHHVSRTQGQGQFDVRPCGICDDRIGAGNRPRELRQACRSKRDPFSVQWTKNDEDTVDVGEFAEYPFEGLS